MSWTMTVSNCINAHRQIDKNILSFTYGFLLELSRQKKSSIILKEMFQKAWLSSKQTQG